MNFYQLRAVLVKTLMVMVTVSTLMLLALPAMANDRPLIFTPFAAGSDWVVVQGQHGSYSHRGNQEYGYDFVAATGDTFGKNVYAPANGEIVEVRAGVRDWQNNSSSNSANNYGWGNTLVLKVRYQDEDYFIRIAHFMYRTINHFRVGDEVDQGELLGKVGQTGYSTNPHLHLQVQKSVRGDSVDFDFVEHSHPDEEDVVTSRLKPKLWVVDNYGRTNAGSELDRTSTAIYKSWRYWSEKVPRTVGTYATSDDMNARYFWYFDLPAGGRYDVYASCQISRSRTSRAKYRFYGPGISEYSYIDQRTHSPTSISGMHQLHYIDTVFPASGGVRYKMRVEKITSGRVCADAIFLHKRD